MNLPNRITLARICLIPIMMFFLLVDFKFYPEPIHWGSFQLSINHLIAAVIFLLAASTDGIDGYIARKYNMVTNLGKLLDPLADKLLVSAVLISLVELGRCDSWIAIVIISREFAVTGLRQVALLEGKVVAASKWGKIKTVTQIVAISLLLLNNFPFQFVSIPLDDIAIWAAALITIYSGIDYFVKNKELLELHNA
ncbi:MULTISPECIES: CDP-diacylglycerol--glycerol-3-phosphate 3-phosphatidyltransferase [Paenibacillus]|uniref:CDP-diacylglycerol--glycerol-3-phosphate 3-phosphatidyltransferase n=1 Tax=Paenibacillus typhae TaxID=1174501 RepID=A0A1G8LCQ8_9BACL|nr:MULTISPECIES: CDP-diacylglycerol--glycerol-3-phosphate 3-phosphatidyltransferase [Paenibacillus]KUP24292.1 CDP-diacylglycerol--glycerol-3-phosphate 3-phosphatidyltransferase [Paenibacillus sp. DMB5]MDF9841310.1 CDP-diacylglycerol--glycerol-3-phosphate 3-phosphatidyltransferase [Paenibacillus sp. PastF-2]MDF9847901.1 CDP-diacylglycerol--glycerol-3-phosphate 3-phosphatidyltransferase [Paenibacillus sp. PastM-2]MDF9854469.1 CDP-diacylglycerol--glycerol-3-phosphate 3-phosphatidyltransferase [Pae